MQQHPPIVRQKLATFLKKRLMALFAKVLKGTDADDSIHRLVELFPTLKNKIDLAVYTDLATRSEGMLVFRKC